MGLVPVPYCRDPLTANGSNLTSSYLSLPLSRIHTLPMFLTSVPVELLEQIFKHVLFSRGRRPTALLRTNKFIYEICLPMLHSDLVFSSPIQLSLFASHCLLAVSPRTLSLSLPGAVVDSSVFTRLQETLTRCLQSFPLTRRLQLHSVRFCLNSHPLSVSCSALFQALSLTEYVLSTRRSLDLQCKWPFHNN